MLYSAESGYSQLEYALIAETSRFLINALFDSSTSKKIRGFKKELSQMKHESWDKILKDSARRLDERT
jgi:hypothetical protein